MNMLQRSIVSTAVSFFVYFAFIASSQSTPEPPTDFTKVETLILTGTFTEEEWTVLSEMMFGHIPEHRRLALLLNLLEGMDITDNVVFLMKKMGVGYFLMSFVLFSLVLLTSFYMTLQFFLGSRNRQETPSFGYTELEEIVPTRNDSRTSIHELPISSPRPGPSYDPESKKPDSPLLEPNLHPCQATIQYADGTLCASAFRYRNDLLITATHAINSEDRLLLVGRNGVKYAMGASDFNIVKGSDMCYAILPTSIWSNLRIANGDPVKKVENNMPVSVSSPEKSSSGLLTATDYIFHYEYTGSTLPGFSGAPYMQANRIAGMHLGAGTLNIGLSIKAIDMLLDNPNVALTSDPSYEGERNKRGTKKANRKVTDDSYLDYVRDAALNGSRRYEAHYVNGQNDDHGVLIKGLKGRIVYAEEAEDWMDITSARKKQYQGESVALHSNTLTPQFDDQPSFLDERPSFNRKDPISQMVLDRERKNAAASDSNRQSPAPKKNGSKFQKRKSLAQGTNMVSTACQESTRAPRNKVSKCTSV